MGLRMRGTGSGRKARGARLGRGCIPAGGQRQSIYDARSSDKGERVAPRGGG